MSYFKEFKELLLRAPKHYCPRQDNVNSEYSAFTYRCKNAYMVFASNYNEDCFYLHLCQRSRDCSDCEGVWDSELCYEGVDCYRLYNSDFCQDSSDLSDCFLCEYCQSCKNLFGCSGLRRAEYCIFNKKVGKEEYENRISELKKRFFTDRDSVLAEFEKVCYEEPRCLFNIRCDETVIGSYNANCKNCYEVYDSLKCEDCCYLYREAEDNKDCVDGCHIFRSELCYDAMAYDNAYNCDHSFWVINCSDCDYCYCVNSCYNCFMCTNLKHKKFHILNKPYGKEEYFKKVAEIKDELSREGLRSENLAALALHDIQKEIGDCNDLIY